jgi:hypothetical protein
MGVALYFLDKLALRAGHEKDDDEADTVGCCTLRVGGPGWLGWLAGWLGGVCRPPAGNPRPAAPSPPLLSPSPPLSVAQVENVELVPPSSIKFDFLGEARGAQREA